MKNIWRTFLLIASLCHCSISSQNLLKEKFSYSLNFWKGTKTPTVAYQINYLNLGKFFHSNEFCCFRKIVCKCPCFYMQQVVNLHDLGTSSALILNHSIETFLHATSAEARTQESFCQTLKRRARYEEHITDFCIFSYKRT